MKLKILGDLSYFWQWDANRKLIVEDGGVCSQVHYCNGSGESLVCVVRTEGDQRVADVPNILLQQAKPIKAYLYTEAEDGTRTRSSHRFTVLARSKPEGYVYTETEALNYVYLDNRLKDLEGEGLANAVNEALAQAQASGEFKGEPGDDYVLTEADKTEIAKQTAGMVEIPECDAVKTVNGITPDENGNVEIETTPDELEQIALLTELGMLPAVHDTNGAILTDENGNVILRY